MSFKSLVHVVSEQCQEVKQAIALFPYFNTWEPNVIAECCRVSSLSESPPDEIVLGPGAGNSYTVYFILDGICKMVKHLHVEMEMNSRGKLIHKLYKPAEPKTYNFEKKDERYLSRLFNGKLALQNGRNSDRAGEMEKEAEGAEVINETQRDLKQEESEANSEEEQKPTNEFADESRAEDIFFEVEAEMSESKRKTIFESDHHVKVLEECENRRKETYRVLKKQVVPEKPKNVKSLFIETGYLFPGASFGLGKIGKENFVMSWTASKFLKIPLRFLLEHNPCNIWNRISLFYSLYLFQDEKILEYLQSERNWSEEKKRQTEEICSSKSIPNYTLISDTPYSIRLSSTR